MFKDQLAIIKDAKKKLFNMLEYKEDELRRTLKEYPNATLALFEECKEYENIDNFRMIHLYSDGTESDYYVVNYYLTIDEDFDIECIGYTIDGDVRENIAYEEILELLPACDLEYIYDYFVRNIERVKSNMALIID